MHTSAAGVRSLGVSVDLHALTNLASPLGIANAIADVRKLSKAYDLVHAQFGSACGFVTAASGARAVLSLRGSDWHRYSGPVIREAIHAQVAGMLSRVMLSRFSAVVTMSERMTREVCSYLPRQKVVTITDPIDTTLFVPRDRNVSRSRMFGSARGGPWVLFTTLSKSNPIKRVDLAEEAVRRASRRLQGLRLRVASGIPHAEMPYFVSACDVVLCTSTHEGWPNSVKEGLACGLPFVSTDVSDLRCIAGRHDSCRVATEDPDQLAEGIVHALSAPRDMRLRDEVMPMTVEVASRKLLELYEVVARSR